jgi:AmmeMemoRadiSam system protein B
MTGRVYSRIHIPATAIILSPNHTGMGVPYSVWSMGDWQTPLGPVPVNSELRDHVLDSDPLYQKDTKAHLREHSIEVQLPFLRYLRSDISIVPITVAAASATQLIQAGKSLSRAVTAYGKPVLVIASSDMTHFEPAEKAREKDETALAKVEGLDARGLVDIVLSRSISMCGYAPTAMMLAYSVAMNAAGADIVGYCNSGDASGDFSSVVGYAGAIIR